MQDPQSEQLELEPVTRDHKCGVKLSTSAERRAPPLLWLVIGDRAGAGPPSLPLLLAAAAVLGAGAASAATLVGNTGQVSNATAQLLSAADAAQAFTTGPNAATLTGVTIKFDTAPDSTTTVTAFIADGLAGTDSKVVNLTNPATWSTTSTFGVPSATTLDANTTYYLVISSDDGDATDDDAEGKLASTGASNADSGEASGWTMGFTLHRRTPRSTTLGGTFTSILTERMQFSIEGTLVIAVPDKPTGLTADGVSPTIIELSWTAPGDTGGAGLTYKIERRVGTGTWMEHVANTGNADVTYTDTGLTASTDYSYRITAMNSAGPGPVSGTQNITSPDLPMVTIEPTELREDGMHVFAAAVTEGSDVSFTLSRTGDGRDGDAITVNVDVASTGDMGLPGAGSVTVAMAAGTRSVARTWSSTSDVLDEVDGTVTATLATGTGYTLGTSATATVTVEDDDEVADAVTDLNATGIDRGATLDWTNPASLGTSPISRTAFVRYSSDNGVNWSAWDSGPWNDSGVGASTAGERGDLFVGGLTNGTVHTFEILLQTDAGRSGRSNAALGTPVPKAAITGIEISSEPGLDNMYVIGDVVTFTVTFDKELSILDLNHNLAPAFLDWQLGPAATATTTTAECDLGTNTRTLVCTSTVAENWTDADGISVNANAFRDNGFLRYPHTANGDRVNPDHGPVATDPDHKIDGVRPSVTTASAKNTTLTLGWSRTLNETAPPVTAFTLSVDGNPGPAISNAVISATTTTLTLAAPITDASMPHRLAYTVPATNPVLDSLGNPAAAFDIVVDALVGLPGAPTGLTADGVSPTIIELSWTAPGDTGGAGLTYKIERLVGTGTWMEHVANTGNADVTYTDTGLMASTDYSYRITAMNSAGPGPASGTQNITSPDLPMVTIAATAASVTEGSDVSFTLSRTGDGRDGDAITVNVNVASTGAMGLPGAGSVTVNMAAGTRSVARTWSSTGDVLDEVNGTVTATLATGTGYTLGTPATATVTVEDDDEVPARITDLIAEGLDGHAELRWTWPNLGTSSSVLTVTVRYSSDNGNNWSAWSSMPWNDTGLETEGTNSAGMTVGGLTNGTAYIFEIRVHSAAGEGDSSNQPNATPTPPPVITGIAITSDPGADNTYMIGDTITFTVTFDKVLSVAGAVTNLTPAFLRWQLQSAAATSTDHPQAECAIGTDTKTLVCTNTVVEGWSDTDGIAVNENALTDRWEGRYIQGPLGQRVHRNHDALDTDASHKIDGVRPTITSATVKSTTVTVEWDEPLNTTAPPTTAFTLNVDGSPGPAISNAAISATTATLTLASPITDASKAHRLVYAVPGSNPIRDVAGNNALAFDNLLAAQVGLPGAPTGFTAEAFSPTKIDLEWTAPEDTGGADLTYKIERAPAAAGPWSDLVSNTGNAQVAYTDSGLHPSATHHYRVTAINSAGTGSASGSDSATAPALPVGSIAPQANSVLEGSTASFDITFTGNINDIDQYTVAWTTTGAMFDATFASGEATVTFAGSGSLDIESRNDRIDEPGGADGSVTATLVATDHYTVSADDGSSSVTVTDDDDPPSLTLTVDLTTIAEDGGEATLTISTGTGSTFATDQDIGFVVQGSASLGDDFTFEAFAGALTLPAGVGSEPATATQTLRATNDRIDDDDETIEIRGSHDGAAFGTLQTITITDDDDAPSLTLAVTPGTLAENGGTASVTVSTGSGSTFATDQSILFTTGGTATPGTDYQFDLNPVTLPAGDGDLASTVTATVEGIDDDLDDDDETIEITGTRNGSAFGSRRTVTIIDDDWPELTVRFPQANYRIVEGGATTDLSVVLSAVPEREVSIQVAVTATGGATAADDYTVSPTSLTFAADDTVKVVRVLAAADDVVDPAEGFTLTFGTPLPERITEGSVASVAVAVTDTDFQYAPVFSAGPGATETASGVFQVSEAANILRLALALETPNGVVAEDVLGTVNARLVTRENAGVQGSGEGYAAQESTHVSGDYGALDRQYAFLPGDFTDDATCGCARAEKAVSVTLFSDRNHEPDEVFGLRMERVSGRLSVARQDITVRIAENDAEPVLLLEAEPAIAESGGVTTVRVTTGTGSTFAVAQTIILALSGTATEDTDFSIDSKRLTLPQGRGNAIPSARTAVRSIDDAIDDDAETVVLSGTHNGAEFDNRTVTIIDDEVTSTQVDLSASPAQVREDAGATTVRVTATLNQDARAEDTEVTVTVGASGDPAVEGTDYATVADLALTIPSGATSRGGDRSP